MGEPAALQQGLWGRSGLRSQPSKTLIVLYIAVIFCGYCFSLLINGAAGRLFRPRYVLPALAPGADPLTPLGTVVLVLDPMLLLAALLRRQGRGDGLRAAQQQLHLRAGSGGDGGPRSGRRAFGCLAIRLLA